MGLSHVINDEEDDSEARMERIFGREPWYGRLRAQVPELPPPVPPQRFRPRENVLVRRERVMEAFETALKAERLFERDERSLRKSFVDALDLIVQAVNGEKELTKLGKRNKQGA